MQKLSGFTFPYPDTPKTHPILPFPIRMHPKPTRFYTQTVGEGHSGAYAFAPLHGYVQNLTGFIFPHTDTPKTRPVLGANPCRGVFQGRMQYAPTRVRAKFGGFHISSYGYTENAPRFTFPNKDVPKSRPVLHPNRRRETFRGVCFCALHGYTQQIVWFHISAPEYAKNAPDFTLSNKDTPKTCSILDPNLRRGYLRGVCNMPLHGYVQNLAGFRPKPSSQDISGRMLLRPTRVREKPVRFHIFPIGIRPNPVRF